MKRLLSLFLAALMLAAALAGCAAAPEARASFAANIRLTSSDAADAAAWLSSRLGERLTDTVVLGTDAEGYALDVSTLEDDGYFIRSLGDEVALLARTTDGLDRAVRKYAKMIETGSVSDVTYHEGARIKKLTIAGRDISEYTICTDDEPHIISAANELSARIAQACGVKLAVSTGDPAAPYIALRYVHDEALSTCGYRWSVDEAGLTIECSDGYKPSAAHFAVARFLETRLGWFGLTFGYETLAASDLVSIVTGESGGEVNAFAFLCPYGDQKCVDDIFEHAYTDHYDNGDAGQMCGIKQSCHGMQVNKFGGELSQSPDNNWQFDQPCYLDEEFFELSLADVSAYIEDKLGAGTVIGEDFCFVDIAAGDNNAWCQCKECQQMFKREGGAYSASVLTWANRLSDALDEKYPGLCYGVFAYYGTNRPPKSVVPNEHLYITYCYDMSCDMHSHDGKNCTGEEPLFHYSYMTGRDNATMSAQLRRWTELTPNVYVWFYGMAHGCPSDSFVHTVRDDITFFHSLGIKGIFWESEDAGFSTCKAAKWLMSGLCWNIGMTDGEYDAYYDRVLAALYGEDAAPLIKDCISAMDAIHQSGACAHCWHNGVDRFGGGASIMPKLWEQQFDSIFALSEAALPLAETRLQEWRLTKLSINIIYLGCISSYFPAYDRGDDIRVAELSRRWSLINERLLSFGYDMTKENPDVVLADPTKGNWESDLEVMAWTRWTAGAGLYVIPVYELVGLTLPTREMPERVAAILAGREAD